MPPAIVPRADLLPRRDDFLTRLQQAEERDRAEGMGLEPISTHITEAERVKAMQLFWKVMEIRARPMANAPAHAFLQAGDPAHIDTKQPC
eukprot:6065248-Prymnesium_polylepis.4